MLFLLLYTWNNVFTVELIWMWKLRFQIRITEFHNWLRMDHRVESGIYQVPSYRTSNRRSTLITFWYCRAPHKVLHGVCEWWKGGGVLRVKTVGGRVKMKSRSSQLCVPPKYYIQVDVKILWVSVGASNPNIHFNCWVFTRCYWLDNILLYWIQSHVKSLNKCLNTESQMNKSRR